MAGAGIQTSAIAFGGSPPRTGATEFWNGSSWTEISDMAVARQNGTGNGSSASALSVGGESPLSPAVTATVEEWDGVEVNQRYKRYSNTIQRCRSSSIHWFLV